MHAVASDTSVRLASADTLCLGLASHMPLVLERACSWHLAHSDMWQLFRHATVMPRNPTLYPGREAVCTAARCVRVTLVLVSLQFIKLLRELKLRVKLRGAHERMAAQFPLTDELWLEWVADELETVRGAPDQHLTPLCTSDT